MSIKDMINSALTKDATSFETAFDTVMADKVETAIAAKYDAMFGDSAESQVAEAPAEAEVQSDEE